MLLKHHLCESSVQLMWYLSDIALRAKLQCYDVKYVDTAARYCWQALMWTVCSMSRYSAAVDNHILSIT